MKLLRQTRGSWQYVLNQNEATLLVDLLRRFPLTEDPPAQICRADLDPDAMERENLLREFLSGQREELREHARSLITGGKFGFLGQDILLQLNHEEREMLLKILNDLRLGSWHSLGQPEECDSEVAGLAPQELALHSLMNLAGYFEHHLLDPR